jgi:hypothetical protein
MGLINLLNKNGWAIGRYTKHGVSLAKTFGDRTRVTVIPNTRSSLPKGTLAAILGPKQTGIGTRGLLKLLNKLG